MSELAMRQRRLVSAHLSEFGPEFFHPLPVAAVVLFALNNFYLKLAHASFLTGKLSDVTACFFLPLFVSAVLDLASGRALSLRVRMTAGSVVTALLFAAVKLDETASVGLTRALDRVNAVVGLPATSNVTDASDLLALPCVALAFAFALRRERGIGLARP